MKTQKIYIPEFYIKNIFLSFLGLIVIATISSLILDNAPQSYEYAGIASAILVAMLGAIIMGYCNASSASKYSNSKPLYLHVFLIIFLFITDTIWGESSFLITLLRNLAYFLFLELGVYLYLKRKVQNERKI